MKLTDLSDGNWRKKARESEPRAWEAFLRVSKGELMNDRAEIYWHFFLAGWKRRARSWPFNTATGFYRKAIQSG